MAPSTNPLFPVFLKLESLQVLLVGGGNVALEKLTAILRNCPDTPVRLVAPFVRDEVAQRIAEYGIDRIDRKFRPEDLDGIRFAFVAIDDAATSAEIARECRTRNVPVNVADTPALCDFYLGSVVTKGQLKIGISTNGSSPTIAKRLRENLDEVLPEEFDELLSNMSAIRATLSGDFADKVRELNAITEKLAVKEKGEGTQRREDAKEN